MITEILLAIAGTLLLTGSLVWLWSNSNRSLAERHRVELENVRLQAELQRLQDELNHIRHTRATYNGLMDCHADIVVLDKLLEELKARLWTLNTRLGKVKSGPYSYDQ
jgi:predicted nuclease with TOPRIM domain